MIVLVEISPDTHLPLRILRTKREAYGNPNEVVQMEKALAVGSIRWQVFERAKRGEGYVCEFCGEPINQLIGEMHEKVPRSKGGDISLANCVAICHDCHTGKKDSEHGDRRWNGRN